MKDKNFGLRKSLVNWAYVLLAPIVYIFIQNLVYSICKMNDTAYTFFSGISCIVSIVVMYFLFFRRINSNLKNYSVRETQISFNFKMLPWIIIAGATSCYILNAVVSLTNITDTITSYSKVSERIYSGNILLVEIQTVLLAPLSEELFFRGVLYQGLIPCVGKIAAAIVSLLFFGLLHGNLLQGIYAFIMGITIIFLYERFQSLWACIFFHVIANFISFIGTKTYMLDVLFSSKWAIILFIILSVMLFVISIIKIATNDCYYKYKSNRDYIADLDLQNNKEK